MANTTSEMARKELARRELERRKNPDYFDLPRSAVAGGLGLARNTLNIPHDIEELGQNIGNQAEQFMPIEKYVPGFKKQEFPQILNPAPYFEETDFAKMLGRKGQDTILDKVLQQVIAHTPELFMTKGLVKPGLSIIGKTSKAIANAPVKGYQSIKQALKPGVKGASEKAALESNEALKAYQDLYEKQGSQSVDSMAKNKFNLENKLPKVEEALLENPEPLMERSKNYEQPKSPIPQHEEQLAQHEQNIAQAEERALQAEQNKLAHKEENASLLKTAEQKAAEEEKNIGSHLGLGQTHDVRASRIIKKNIEEKKAEIGKGYDKEQAAMKSKNVVIENPRSAKQIMDKINQVIKEGGLESKELQKLGDELKTAGKKEIIPANDFLSLWRSTRDAANEFKLKSRKEGIDAKDRDFFEKKGKELESKQNKMWDLLQDSIGDESAENILKLNKRWKEEVTPVYKNEVYQKAKHEEKNYPNIMFHLRGGKLANTKGEPIISGENLLGNMAKKDPELLRHLIAQEYEKNPESIYEANELMKEFLPHDAKLNKFIENHKSALDEVSRLKAKHAETEAAHDKLHSEAKKDVTHAKAQHTKYKSEATKEKNKFEAEESERKKVHKAKLEAKKRENEHHGIKSEKEDIEAKIKDLDSKISALKVAKEKKDLTLKKKMQLEKQYKDAYKTRGKLLGATGTYLAYKARKHLL